jgi:hypothetical protein
MGKFDYGVIFDDESRLGRVTNYLEWETDSIFESKVMFLVLIS